MPSCIKLPTIHAYGKYYNGNLCMDFFINDKEMLKKYTQIWDKIKNLLRKNLALNLCIIMYT